jgi:ABC-type uncharacterized transport system permease subunit
VADIFTLALVFSTIRLATPLVFAAMGGLFSERAGIINVALEGLLLAVVCIRYQADAVVAGMGINILFIGLPAVLSGALFTSSGSTPQLPQEQLVPAFAQVSVFSMLAALVVAGASYVMYRTRFGLRVRAVGENPAAADAAGVRVARIRYAAVILSGALAAIGGAYLSIGQASLFTRNMTAGRGFIAVAALIFGKWRPVPTMLACVLFGFAEAITIQMQGVAKLPSGEDIPVQFVQMIPYIVTIVVLAGFIGHSRAPAALGTPYVKER